MNKFPPSCAFDLSQYCAFQVSFLSPHFSSYNSLSDLQRDCHDSDHPKITSDQRENQVASAPGCFCHLHPAWLATFNLLIQYLVTLFRDSSEHGLAHAGDLNSLLTNFTRGLGKSPRPSGWLFMFLSSSPFLGLLKVYSWEEFPHSFYSSHLSVWIAILSPFQTHFWI